MMRGAIRCGENSLSIYCLGVLLALASHMALVDISDGLAGDLTHILERSAVGATVDVDALPIGPVLGGQPQALRRSYALAGGDDYELCFTAPRGLRTDLQAVAARLGVALARVGTIDAGPGLRLVDRMGAPLSLEAHSFDHFMVPAP